MLAATADPPAPRRIRLDATGWALVREGAEAAGLRVATLPTTGQVVADRGVAHRHLVAAEVLQEDGRPTRTVHAALAVLTTGSVTVTVERRQADRRVAALWRTLGAPTAGVVVRGGDHDPTSDGGATADAAPPTDDGVVHPGVELQLLAVDHLADAIVDELLGPAPAAASSADGPSHLDVEVATDDPDGWPAGVVVDGEVTAQADLLVAGPAGTSVARLWGDGRRWWQVGASGPDRLRGIALTHASVRATVVTALTDQLGSAAPGAQVPGGAGRG